ncbi:MAG: hypothetical protein AAGU23_00545 [Bacillota bacterium]
MNLINNNQAASPANVSISGVLKYAVNDYGSSWATSATIAADLAALFPEAINGDAAILRNTNGTDESRLYFYAASAWDFIPAATIGAGSVTTAKLAAGVISADASGRALFANDVLNNATCDAIFAAAAFAADADSRAIFADGVWNLAKLATTAKTHILNYQVSDLGAGVDIAAQVIFSAPAGLDVTLVSASIIPQGTAAGIDDSNTCVIALTDGTNTIVTQQYDTSPAFPAAAAVTSLGTLDETYKVLSAGEKLYLSVTNGTTANPPAFMLQVVYTVADAA